MVGEVAKVMQLPALPEDLSSGLIPEGTRLSSGAQIRIQTNIHTHKINQYFLKLFLKHLIINVFLQFSNHFPQYVTPHMGAAFSESCD